MKLNHRKKSEDSKSNFYLQPYTTSVSHEPPSSTDNMDYNRSRSHSNISEYLDQAQHGSNSPSNQCHNSTLSRLGKIFRIKPKKMPQTSSAQNVSNVDNEEFKHLISCPGQFTHTPQIKTPKSCNFTMDPENRQKLKEKLNKLTTEERIELQRKGLRLLLEQLETKKKEKQNIEQKINETNTRLITRRQPFRSLADIEKLKDEIRNLANEKATLEFKFKQNETWKCSKCTYENLSSKSRCEICHIERQLNEFILCKCCSYKNSLSASICINCADLLLDKIEENQRIRQSSNSSSCSSGRLNSVNGNAQNGLNVPIYADGQTSYITQSKSSSILPAFHDNPVYFNLSSNNLYEMGDAHGSTSGSQLSANNWQDALPNQPTIPVVVDTKCKFKKKNL